MRRRLQHGGQEVALRLEGLLALPMPYSLSLVGVNHVRVRGAEGLFGLGDLHHHNASNTTDATSYHITVYGQHGDVLQSGSETTLRHHGEAGNPPRSGRAAAVPL